MQCEVCGSELKASSKTCSVCGTNAPSSPVPSESGAAPVPAETQGAGPAPPAPPSDAKVCSVCGAAIPRSEPDWADGFHAADGGELKGGDAGAPAVPPPAPASPPPAPTPAPPAPTPSAPPAPPRQAPPRPKAGTTCLVVYDERREVIGYFPIARDITKIGRCDPVAGEFPDIDLAQLFPEESARKVSRKHALVIRSRETGKITLRPLAKNTGTQVEQEVCIDKKDYPLVDGSRVLLGRTVRMKLEVIK